MKKEVEVVVREPKNQRIRTMFKANLSEMIRSEIKISLENVLYQQTMQFEYLFQLIDYKQLSGLLMELKTSILGIDEFNKLSKEERKIYSAQYFRDLDSIFNSLINIVTQLLIDVKKIPDGFFDQTFIRNLILSLIGVKQLYIDTNMHLMPAKKKLLNGLIKDLIESYNFRLSSILTKIDCQENFFSRILLFSQYLAQFHDITVASFEFIKDSQNIVDFREQVKQNLIDITFKLEE